MPYLCWNSLLWVLLLPQIWAYIRPLTSSVKLVVHKAGTIEELTEQYLKNSKLLEGLIRSTQQLTKYNQNSAEDLELATRISLKSYLVRDLGIPEEFIADRIDEILSPLNGEVAVEWDGLLMLSYNDTTVRQPQWPLNNTIFLLETKQRVEPSEIIPNMLKRIDKTKTIIQNKTILTNKVDAKKFLAVQNAYFPLSEYHYIGVIASSSFDKKKALEILDAGFLAIVPSGEDYSVCINSTYIPKIFNITTHSSSIMTQEDDDCIDDGDDE